MDPEQLLQKAAQFNERYFSRLTTVMEDMGYRREELQSISDVVDESSKRLKEAVARKEALKVELETLEKETQESCAHLIEMLEKNGINIGRETPMKAPTDKAEESETTCIRWERRKVQASQDLGKTQRMRGRSVSPADINKLKELSVEEVMRIPVKTRGKISRPELNEVIAVLRGQFLAKRSLLIRPRNTLSVDQMRRVDQWTAQVIGATNLEGKLCLGEGEARDALPSKLRVHWPRILASLVATKRIQLIEDAEGERFLIIGH